jgi:hypothetical protein
VFVYAALFGAGLYLMGRHGAAAIAGVALVVSGLLTWRAVSRLWR